MCGYSLRVGGGRGRGSGKSVANNYDAFVEHEHCLTDFEFEKCRTNSAVWFRHMPGSRVSLR